MNFQNILFDIMLNKKINFNDIKYMSIFHFDELFQKILQKPEEIYKNIYHEICIDKILPFLKDYYLKSRKHEINLNYFNILLIHKINSSFSECIIIKFKLYQNKDFYQFIKSQNILDEIYNFNLLSLLSESNKNLELIQTILENIKNIDFIPRLIDKSLCYNQNLISKYLMTLDKSKNALYYCVKNKNIFILDYLIQNGLDKNKIKEFILLNENLVVMSNTHKNKIFKEWINESFVF